MSVDLSDPEIVAGYEAVLDGSADWLLLKHANRDRLFLAGIGNGTIDDLRPNVDNDIYFGFATIDDPSAQLEGPHFLVFSFVPEGTSGVRRARALVHGRAVASLFKAHHSSMSFTQVSQLSSVNIRSQITMARSKQNSNEPRLGLPPSPRSTRHRILDPKSPSVTGAIAALSMYSESAPPTPPKAPNQRPAPPPFLAPVPRRAVSEDTAGPSKSYLKPNPTNANPTTTNTMPRRPPPQRSGTSGTDVRPLKVRERTTSAPDKPVIRVGSAVPLEQDPEVQERVKAEVKRLREEAERQMRLDEEEASKAPKVIMKKAPLVDPMEEKRKRAEAERERQKRIAERRLIEQQKKEEEEREERERQARLVAERERRIQAAREAAVERKRVAQEKERDAKREAEFEKLKKAQIKSHTAKVAQLFSKIKDPLAVLVSGFVNVQPGDSINWKLRYFELSRSAMTFYKDDTKAKLFEQFTIPRRIAGAKEWDDGFEELRAIEHSFAVTFTDGESPWLFYVDTNELKGTLVGLMNSFAENSEGFGWMGSSK